MIAGDAGLLLGATVRLTRLVTTDDLGLLVRQPAYTWAHRHCPDTDADWRWKAYGGLTCPFCVGYWLGVLMLAAYAPPRTRRLWRFVAAGLTLNEVAGHLSARLDQE